MTTKGRKLSEAHVAGDLLPASASTVSQGLVPKHSTRVTTGRRDVSEAGSLSHSFLVEHSAHRTSNFLCYMSSVQRCWSRTLHRSPTQRFVVQSTRCHLNKSIDCFLNHFNQQHDAHIIIVFPPPLQSATVLLHCLLCTFFSHRISK